MPRTGHGHEKMTQWHRKWINSYHIIYCVDCSDNTCTYLQKRIHRNWVCASGGRGIDNLFYRPQQSCEGYVFTPVCLSTGGSTWAGTPQDQAQPPGPGTHPPGTRYPPDQVHPPGTRYTHIPWDQVPPPGPGTPPETATVADGTHPTGMHSCL